MGFWTGFWITVWILMAIFLAWIIFDIVLINNSDMDGEELYDLLKKLITPEEAEHIACGIIVGPPGWCLLAYGKLRRLLDYKECKKKWG